MWSWSVSWTAAAAAAAAATFHTVSTRDKRRTCAYTRWCWQAIACTFVFPSIVCPLHFSNTRHHASLWHYAPRHPLYIRNPPGAGNDYQKDLQFRKLNAQKDIIEDTVVRGGETMVSVLLFYFFVLLLPLPLLPSAARVTTTGSSRRMGRA